MIDWIKIRTEYITDPSTGYQSLSKKYGVNFTTLSKRAKREGWVAQRKKHTEKMVMKNIKQAQKDSDRYRSILYRAAARVAEQIDGLVKDASMTELAKIGLKPRDITGAIKDLEDALHIKSAADLEEQAVRIAKLKKEVEESDKDDKTVRVVISGDAEDYST